MRLQLPVMMCLLSGIFFSCAEQAPQQLIWETTDLEFAAFEKPYLTTEEVEQLQNNQQRAFYYSYLGDTRRALTEYDLGCEKIAAHEFEETEIATFNFLPALDYLVERARDEKLIIINEAHHIPEHRAFTRELLSNIRELGFNHLGLEALDNNFYEVMPASKPGFPFYNNGYYVREVEMARLLRTSIENGYSLFPYEASGQSGASRESAQAQNIADYMSEHPNDKFLIHCGYNHAREGKMGDYWGASMAERLGKLTGINPLTIDQTFYRERGNKDCEHPIYKVFKGNEPSVLTLTNGAQYQDSDTAWMDIYLLHPRSNEDLKKAAASNSTIAIDLSELDLTKPVILRLYRNERDYATSVPDDVLELTNENTIEVNALTKTIIAKSKSGTKRIARIR